MPFIASQVSKCSSELVKMDRCQCWFESEGKCMPFMLFRKYRGGHYANNLRDLDLSIDASRSLLRGIFWADWVHVSARSMVHKSNALCMKPTLTTCTVVFESLRYGLRRYLLNLLKGIS